ncbi:MAG TPA: PorV/PorQ family protein [Candidatus Eisenbacteria bacterium]|nr:PorV/PorQ family protein [Candidatus Eisenbacteria bacterium]
MRTNAVRALLGLALIVAAAGPAFAGSEERKGTNGAFELQIPVGARGTALGGALGSDVSGVESIFYNPAGLGLTQTTEALFTHTAYFADQKLNYAAVATKLGNFGVLGFSAKVLSVGDVIVTTEDQPEGTGEIADPTFIVLGGSYGRQFTDRVTFGFTVNYVNENILNTTASGVAFDFGVQYLTGWNGLKFGMTMKNFGPNMQFHGPGFEFATQTPGSDPSSSPRITSLTSSTFEMPSYFNLSASYNLMSASDRKLMFVGSFQNNNFQGDDVRGGLEWSYRNTFALRGSYFGSFHTAFDAATQTEGSTSFRGGDDLYSGFAFGAGANVRTGDTGRLGVDFAWRPVRNFFNDTYETGIRFTF